MIKKSIMAAVAFLSICMLTLPNISIANAETLQIAGENWSYGRVKREAYYNAFETLTNGHIIMENWDGELDSLNKDMENGDSLYDIAEVSARQLYEGCADGLFTHIEDGAFGDASRYFDGMYQECGAGAAVRARILVYPSDLDVEDEPQSWADMWRDDIEGLRLLPNNARDTLEIALLADGVLPSELYDLLKTDEGQDRAFAKLDEIAEWLAFEDGERSIVNWLLPEEVETEAVEGEVPPLPRAVFAVMDSGRLSDLTRYEDKALRPVWGGEILNLSYWALLADSDNQREAMRFLGFVTQPEQQMILPQLISYSPTHVNAVAQLRPWVARQTPLWHEYAETALVRDEAFWREYGEGLEERFVRWKEELPNRIPDLIIEHEAARLAAIEVARIEEEQAAAAAILAEDAESAIDEAAILTGENAIEVVSEEEAGVEEIDEDMAEVTTEVSP